MRADLAALAALDEELALLAVLTRARVKPAARYERALPQEVRERIAALGLVVAPNRRFTDLGASVEENVFARDAAIVARYLEAFGGTPLRVDARRARLEGELFGFPPCCVEAYIATPYAENGLAPEDQAILFHWACSGCAATAALLPRYRRADAIVRSLRGASTAARFPPAAVRRRPLSALRLP